MSYAKMYTDALNQFLKLKDEKAQRRQEIETEVSDVETHRTLGASREHVVNGRVASDPVSKDLQVLMDRALAEATAYGLGAVIRNLAFLAKREERK